MKNSARILKYIYIPVIITILGYGLIFLAIRPLIVMAYDIGTMIFSGNTPVAAEELTNIYDENIERPTSGTVKLEDIQMPLYEQQYARLSCDRLDMDVAVYWGDSDKVFRKGAGQFLGSAIPGRGKIILLGAHDSMYFAPLEDVKMGDKFTIKTNYGEFKYKVVKTLVSTANDENACISTTGNEQLIMYTCYPFGALIGSKNERFYVYCDLVSGPKVEE